MGLLSACGKGPRRRPAVLRSGDAPVRGLAFSPDRSLVAGGGADVRLWEASSGERVARFGGGFEVWGIAFSPDGRLVAAARRDGVRVWDVERRSPLRSLPVNGDWAFGLAFSPDGRQLAVSGYAGRVELWSVDSGVRLRAYAAGDGEALSVAWSSEGLLAAGNIDGTLHVFSGDRRLTHLRPSGASSGDVNRLAWSPDGRRLATATQDGVVRLFGRDGQARRRLGAHEGWARGLAWSPDGTLLASSGSDGVARLWDVAADRQVRKLQGHDGPVWAVQWSPDGRTLASAGEDATVRLWAAR